MKRRTRRRSPTLLLAVLLAVALAAPALADHEPPRLSLRPIGQAREYFDLTLRAGETAAMQVELAGLGHEFAARTYAADAYSIINGGFGAGLFGMPTSGTTHWLKYPNAELTLAPQAPQVIDFSVTVPDDTPPGEYIAALVAENSEPYRGDTESVAVDQVNRVALAVAIDVPGPREPALDIGAVSHKIAASTSFIALEVANPGNVHIRPSGEFTLRDATGAELVSAPAVMDSVYAGSETLFEVPLANPLAPGEYCAELRLTDAATAASAATACLPFVVEAAQSDGGAGPTLDLRPALDAVAENPLPVALLVLVTLGLLGGFLLLWRRRRRREEEAG